MPALRAFVRTIVFAGLGVFALPSITAQVVIRERVEVGLDQHLAGIPTAFSEGEGEVSITADQDGLLIVE